MAKGQVQHEHPNGHMGGQKAEILIMLVMFMDVVTRQGARKDGKLRMRLGDLGRLLGVAPTVATLGDA